MHIFITYIILESAFLKHIYNMQIYISKIIWKHIFKQLKNIPLIDNVIYAANFPRVHI